MSSFDSHGNDSLKTKANVYGPNSSGPVSTLRA